MTDVEDNWRNRTAVRLCNFILNNLATPTYRRVLDGIIQRGMQGAVDSDLQQQEWFKKGVEEGRRGEYVDIGDGTKTGRMECSKPNLSCPPDKHPLDWVDEG